MISAIDHGDILLLTAEDFHRAKDWLEEAEFDMADIFKAGGPASDGQVMDEIKHYVMIEGRVNETKLFNFARERVPAQSVFKVIEIMERSGMIKAVAIDKRTGMRLFETPLP